KGRFTPLDEMNSSNVKQLRGAWVSEPFLDGATSRSTPIVTDGLLFLTTQSRVYALDAKTGKAVWSYNTSVREGPNGMEDQVQFRVAVTKAGLSVPNTQGVVIDHGLVFVGLYGGEILAVNGKKGEAVGWGQKLHEQPPPRAGSP